MAPWPTGNGLSATWRRWTSHATSPPGARTTAAAARSPGPTSRTGRCGGRAAPATGRCGPWPTGSHRPTTTSSSCRRGRRPWRRHRCPRARRRPCRRSPVADDDPIDPLAGGPYCLQGRVVTMDDAGTVHDDGVVYVAGGRIADVRAATDPRPDAFADAPVVHTGGTIYPGLI